MILLHLAKLLILISFFCLTPRLYANNVTLCYHEFGYSLDNLYEVLPEVFQWQIKHIKQNNLPFVKINDLVKIYCSTYEVVNNNVLITIDDGSKSVETVIPILRKENVFATLYIYPSVIDRKKPYFSKSDLNKLKNQDFIDFGCHSYTHIVLQNLDKAKLQREVVNSKNVLENVLARKLTTFSYPYGMFDKNTKAMVKQNYKLAFGVNDGGNSLSTDKYNLNRFVVYKNTTFGEFVDMIKHATGTLLDYSITPVGYGSGDDKHFYFTKSRLLKFPRRNGAKPTVLIVPSCVIGPAFVYKIIDKLSRSGLQSYVLLNRNNNIPFYRPVKETHVISSWGLKEFESDLKSVFDYISDRKQNITILTWGSGFDLVMAVLVKHSNKYNKFVKNIVAINPSIKNLRKRTNTFVNNVIFYDFMLTNKQYVTKDLAFNLKMKTLADLMLLNPDGVSPVAKKLGYNNITNKQLFFKIAVSENFPSIPEDCSNKEYSFKDFKNVFIQPLPVMDIVVPVKLFRDINNLWSTGFCSQEYGIINSTAVSCPTTVFCSKDYENNVDRIKSTFVKLPVVNQHNIQNMNTVEIMLSPSTVNKIVDEIVNLVQ